MYAPHWSPVGQIVSDNVVILISVTTNHLISIRQRVKDFVDMPINFQTD